MFDGRPIPFALNLVCAGICALACGRTALDESDAESGGTGATKVARGGASSTAGASAGGRPNEPEPAPAPEPDPPRAALPLPLPDPTTPKPQPEPEPEPEPMPEPEPGCDPACGADEVCDNGSCRVSCVFDTSLLPVVIHQGGYNYGDLAFAADCDLLVAGADANNVFRVDHTSGEVVNAVNTGIGVSTYVLGAVYRPSDDRIYFSTEYGHDIYSVDPLGQAKFVINAGSTVNALAVAPKSFGPYADMIIAAAGAIVAIDPAAPSITTIASDVTLAADDLAFAPDGTLYVSDYYTDLVTVSSDGTITPFVGGFDGIDGVAVDPKGGRVFATNCFAFPTFVSQITTPGGVVTNAGEISINGGSYTAGMLMDDDGNLLVLTVAGQETVIDFLRP